MKARNWLKSSATARKERAGKTKVKPKEERPEYRPPRKVKK